MLQDKTVNCLACPKCLVLSEHIGIFLLVNNSICILRERSKFICKTIIKGSVCWGVTVENRSFDNGYLQIKNSEVRRRQGS